MNISTPPERLRSVAASPMFRLNVLAGFTGAAVACLAWLFLQLIDGVQWLFYRDGGFLAHDLGIWALLVPVTGGLVAGLIIKYYAHEARGHGVPVVMEAVAVKQARLSTHVALAKGAAAATCIGTGFSLGRIGPLILMASTFGSEVGQRTGLSVEETRTMVGCGAAAALTTAFNAPLGGVIFAIELILTEFRTRSFIPLVVASVIATAVARTLKGDLTAFDSLPPYSLRSPLEYPLYLVLGVLAGLAATGFIKLLFSVDRLAAGLQRVPLPAQTALGGLAVGAIALSFPEVLGNGFDVTHGMLQGQADTARLRGPEGMLTLGNLTLLLAALFVIKLLATSISIGSGGSGGVFTPSLFLGAALGAAFGLLVAPLGFTAPAGEVLAVVDVEVVQVGRLFVAMGTLAVEELDQRHSAFIVIVGVMPVPLGVLQPPRFRPLWPRLVEEEVPDAAPHEQNRQRHDPHLSRQIIERLAPVPHALLEVAVLFQQLLAPALRSHLISPALPAGHCRRCAAPLP